MCAVAVVGCARGRSVTLVGVLCFFVFFLFGFFFFFFVFFFQAEDGIRDVRT